MEHTNRRRAIGAALTVAGIAAVTIGVAGPARAEEEPLVVYPLLCAVDGVCLNYTAALIDRDRDGVADWDEEVAGTDAGSPASAPDVAGLVGLVGEGALPSFELGFAEVIVLPTTLPDGTPVVDTTFADVRTPTMKMLGIAEETLAAFGLSSVTGFALDQAAGKVGMTLDEQGRPTREKDQAPVEKRVGGVVLGHISADEDGAGMGDQPAMGTDRNGGADTAKTFWDRAKELLFGSDKKPDGGTDGGTTDGGTKPVSLSTGDDGGIAVPLTAEDMERVVVRLGSTTKPVAVDPKIVPDAGSLDLNPRRTIVLTTEGEPSARVQELLKIVLIEPDVNDPNAKDTNFGPNGGIVPSVVPDSGWPKD